MNMNMIESSRKISNVAEIRNCQKTEGKALYASVTLAEGQILSQFSGKTVLDSPNYLTVQLDDQQHIMLDPEYLQYINHSCTPNVLFDTTAKVVKALRQIEADEELTFFYPSTEWSMDQGFDCICQTDNCLHHIQGANYLPQDILPNYQFSTYIQQKLGL